MCFFNFCDLHFQKLTGHWAGKPYKSAGQRVKRPITAGGPMYFASTGTPIIPTHIGLLSVPYYQMLNVVYTLQLH